MLRDHASTPDAKPEATPDAKPATPTLPMPTPDQVAQKFLDDITPSTAVSVTTPDRIAGHDAYQLVLAPHAATSTIDHVAMAIDATNGFPLQVAAWAKGATKPAIQLGFVKLSYAKPSGSFTFTPPPGSHTASSAAATGAERPQLASEGRGDAKNAGRATPGGKALAAFGPAGQSHGRPTVVGQDWLQVVIADHAAIPRDQGFELMKATTPVSGAFGSGRLLHTDLVSVLFLNDGRVAAGFVVPSALEAAVPHA